MNHSRSQSRNCELVYPGKAPADTIINYNPAGKVLPEHKGHNQTANAFYFGDNLPVLAHLRDHLSGKIDLIYIDPPYGLGQEIRDQDEELAYADMLVDIDFLEFMRHRLYLMRELLSEQGTIYLHIGKELLHYLKLIMDEVFGYENHLNDITRIKCNPKNFSRKAYGNVSDFILVYAKARSSHIWNEIRESLSQEEVRRLFTKEDPERGPYTTHPLHAPGTTQNGDTGKIWKGLMPPKGRHWRYSRAELDKLDQQGLIEWSSTGNPRKRVFAANHKGRKIQDVWAFKDKGLSYVDYPTQKNDKMLQRIIQQSSNEASIVLDAFAGSGSTLWNAQSLNRKWIGIDQSPKSRDICIQQMRKQEINYNYFIWEE